MADELEDLRQYVGNSQTADDVITASQAGRLAVALGVDHPAPGKGDAIPPGWHGVFFPPLVPLDRLRADDQPAGGGVAPPVPLPRRRLVAVRGAYHDALRIGDEVTKVTEVADIAIRDFGAGPTALVTVRETITSPRGVAVVVARPFPVTLERMAAWLPMLESRGIEIVPVTALADKQANR